MENPEEILHSLEEFSKMKPKDIPRELEEYLSFVAKTGDPVYQWPAIKSLFREKLINVITDFYETCPSVEIPPCPNVEIFNYDLMKSFILEKLDTFSAAPFTLQRICELLTTPRKEYNRIDKYMRALEKNILVVSTTEPGHKGSENGDSIMNGIEADHVPEPANEINVEEMDDSPSWPRNTPSQPSYDDKIELPQQDLQNSISQGSFDVLKIPGTSSSNQETVISCTMVDDQRYVSIEPVTSNMRQEEDLETVKDDVSVTITAVTTPQVSSSLEEAVVESTQTVAPEIPLNQDTPTSESEVPETQPEPVSQVLIEESSEPPTDAQEPEQKSEDKPIPEESGIENISPETSTSSPENFQTENASTQVSETITNDVVEETQDAKPPEETVCSDKQATEDTKLVSEKGDMKKEEETSLQDADSTTVASVDDLKEEEAENILKPEATLKEEEEEVPVEEKELPDSAAETVSPSDDKEGVDIAKDVDVEDKKVEVPMDIDLLTNSVKSEETAPTINEQSSVNETLS